MGAKTEAVKSAVVGPKIGAVLQSRTADEVLGGHGHATIRVVSGPHYHLGDGGTMAVSGPNLDVANADGGSVTELDITTGAFVRLLTGPGYGFATPDALAVARGELFVANGSGGSVTQLRA